MIDEALLLEMFGRYFKAAVLTLVILLEYVYLPQVRMPDTGRRGSN